MSIIKLHVAILSDDSFLVDYLTELAPVKIQINDIEAEEVSGQVLVFDAAKASAALVAKANKLFKKIVLTGNENSNLQLGLLDDFSFDYIELQKNIDSAYVYKILEEINQADQDLTYLTLSTELNQQYEVLKIQLEGKLKEKSQNLVESRKQIFEINNRVEILRKTLYAISETKNITHAEQTLNSLLIQFSLVSELKIYPEEQLAEVLADYKNKTNFNFYTKELVIGQKNYVVSFTKEDRRTFKKADLNYFNKIAEALEINLNRQHQLVSIQQSERLYDLAFHSSPQPILILDSDYNVYQANLAAEKHSSETSDNSKCYELLFNRKSPCAGCKLGAAFEIQNEDHTYKVRSEKYSKQLDSNSNYWVHLYENVSEQRKLESKFQQAAKLSELGLISSSIAHELNNPLGGIISYLQIMKLELPKGHPFIEEIKYLEEAANKMKKNIEDLLLFSRKEQPSNLEACNLVEVFQKNLDHIQIQLKKENLVVSFQPTEAAVNAKISMLHFRSMIHLIFQFLQHKLKLKKSTRSNFIGLVEVKFSQDQTKTYLRISANLGPHLPHMTSNDLSLITLEKSILDQGFQLFISEPQSGWIQLSIEIN